jgi:ATP-binding cassette subfamily C protein
VRLRWIAFIPLSLVAAGLEFAAALSVFILLGLLNGRDTHWVPALGHDLRSRVLGWTAVVAALYVFKNAFISLLTYCRNRLMADCARDTAVSLLRRYLNAPYEFHLARDSSELISRIQEGCEYAFRWVVCPSMQLVTEWCILLSMVLILLFHLPLIAVAAAVGLLTSLWVLLQYTERLAGRWGDTQIKWRVTRLTLLQRCFHCIEDLLVAKRQNYYIERLDEAEKELGTSFAGTASWPSISYFFVEAGFVLSFLLLSAIAVTRLDTASVLPLLGLYAYAGFRAVPSVSRILQALTQIRSCIQWVDYLYPDWESLGQYAIEAAPVPRLDFCESLACSNVWYRYPGASVDVLKGLDVTIHQGELVAIVGANGAGKSTLLAILLGLLRPTRGAVTIDGAAFSDVIEGWQRSIGFVPQQVHLIDETVRHNVALAVRADAIDDGAVRRALQQASLDVPADFVIGEQGVRLSGGERQRLALARALYGDPRVLILDEPGASLERPTELEILQTLRAMRGERTIIVVTHHTDTLSLFDRVLRLRDGRLAEEVSGPRPLDANAIAGGV